MQYWVQWILYDRRNWWAWIAGLVQGIIVAISHTQYFWSQGIATAFALFTICTAFICLGFETSRRTKWWNGLGRSLTLLSYVTGFIFLPPAINTVVRLVGGDYDPNYTTLWGLVIRDISYVIGVFAPVSVIGHLRHYRRARAGLLYDTITE